MSPTSRPREFPAPTPAAAPKVGGCPLCTDGSTLRLIAAPAAPAGRGLSVEEVDRVVQLLDSDEAPTIAELHRAAEALARYALTGQTAVFVAKVRVAVLLEQLGA